MSLEPCENVISVFFFFLIAITEKHEQTNHIMLYHSCHFYGEITDHSIAKICWFAYFAKKYIRMYFIYLFISEPTMNTKSSRLLAILLTYLKKWCLPSLAAPPHESLRSNLKMCLYLISAKNSNLNGQHWTIITNK